MLGVLVGPVDIGLGGMLESVAARIPFLHVHSPLSATDEAILWDIRMPRVVLGALVGAMLAVAGASYQGVFRNPLADPYLLGVAAGAGLGATIAVVYLRGIDFQNTLPPAAFLGGAVAVVRRVRDRAVGRAGSGGATLVLAGVTVAAFFTAVQTFVQQQHSDTLQQVYSWILGPPAELGLARRRHPAPVRRGRDHRDPACTDALLDVLSVGDEEAASLGVNVGRVRLAVIVCATVGTAAAVAVSGLIGFVGIIVPHAIRLVAGPSYRLLLPLSVLVGGGFLVLADVIARTALSPGEIPIGVVTAFFGAPFFAIVLRTSKRMAS